MTKPEQHEASVNAERKGNIIRTYKFGNSTVNILDSALPKTPEENEERKKEYFRRSWIAWQHIMANDPVCQAYDAAETDEEREALLPALHAAGFTVRPKVSGG